MARSLSALSLLCLSTCLLLLSPLCRAADPAPVPAAAEPAPALKQGKVRVVLVGDSITGQSRIMGVGFAQQMEVALQAVYPGSTPELLSLGGSGQSVGSWLGVEKQSRTEERTLDVKGVSVKATLDQPADVLIIMLGMNDVLAPYVDDSPAALDRWTKDYQTLITALQARVHPGVTALASVTPCTELATSPKNLVIAALNERVRALAQQNGARYLPTNEAVWEIQRHGRMLKPDFHVTADFVHPSPAGHLGIAVGMLRGLGEPAAATWLASQHAALWQAVPGAPLGLSWSVTQVVGKAPQLPEQYTFQVTYWWPTLPVAASPTPPVAPRVTLSVPPGWTVTPATCTGLTGEFFVSGNPNRLRNELLLAGSAGDDTRRGTVVIPAPWLVAAKLIQPVWNGDKFDAVKATTPLDEAFTRGEGAPAGGPIPGLPAACVFKPYLASVNFTGGDNSDSVDFAAVTHAANFEAGYGERWVYSERDRAIGVTIGSQRFAGDMQVQVWLNGAVLSAGKFAPQVVPAKLQRGWNHLAFKANHRNWQWQLSVGLNAATDGDLLADLRYALTPHAVTDPAPPAP